ncbi:CHASE domain-containing protein [Pontibacter chinhatensis]|uniref:histidine kinase n=1 Tax=Pontibacter chinhatensis TaxID=1436961 RepID=A0A1I2U1Y1_9BACT|nr:CHASE domain-containing protein [Pontibacter chinhatensis]SFG68591.1 PAS domain S-box-containing protein [Pontibacter chinhatensis]
MKLAKLASFIRDYFIAIFSFLLIFLLTLFTYSETRKKTEERNAKLFSMRTEQVTEAIDKRMKDYIQILIGGKAMFTSSDSVTRQDWTRYYEALKLEKNYPGMQGFGYTHVVRPHEKEAHEQQIRSEGFENYRITPETPRDLYTAIIFLEPFTDRNLRAFGYDMYSEPVRQSAMRIARDTRQPTMSGKVRLVQETGQDEQLGFLIYLPVYKNNVEPESIQERQRLIKGFVYSPFRVKDLMTAVLADEFDDIDVEIYDGAEPSKENLLFSTSPQLYYGSKAREYGSLSTITIGNHTWRLYATAKEGFGRTTESELPYYILLGGSIISLLMFFIIWSLSNTRRSNTLKQTITDNATAALFILDSKGYCTFMNPAAEEMTGYTLEEMRKKPLHDMVHYKHLDGSPFPAAECPMHNALTNIKPLRGFEDTFIRKDGTFFNVSCSVQPMVESGSDNYTIIEVRDITDEKQARQAIIESEARFRTMADNAPVMIKIMDDATNFMYVNKQWLDFTGHTFEQTINMSWKEVVHPDDIDRKEQVTLQAIKDHSPFRLEYRMRRFDGEYRWVVASNTPRFGANDEFQGYIGSIIDITEIKEAERKIKQNAELLQKLFLEVPAVVGLVRAQDYQYVLANPGYRKLYGNRPLVGRTVFEAHSEEEGQGLFERLEEVFQTGKPFVGNEVPTAIERGGDGELVHGYFNLVYQPLVDANGTVEAVLIFAVEVTELVNARKALLHTNEELSGKNDELQRINNDLDNFVYTASHDLKSPIANMEGLVTLLRDILQGKLEAEDMQVLDMVQSSINKLKGTIADLAEITKVQKELQSAAEPLSFESMLQDIGADLEEPMKETGAVLKTDLQVGSIVYARKNLRSIIYNLVSNAIKYKSPDRPPVINLKTYEQGEYVVLEVQDNGLGIKKEQQHKLFTMFKRLHTHVEGTGIGLYIVKRIIENNGGRIEVDSVHGKGTTFKVYFKQVPVEQEV